MKTYRMLIDGEWVEAQSGKTFDVMDPATGRGHGQGARGRPRPTWTGRSRRRGRAFDEGWRDVTAQERGRILFRLAQKMRDELPRLAELETLNSGKPIVESEFDLDDVATCFEYYGGLATKIHGEVLPVPDNAISLALREPLGVAGQIIPWNYPLLMAAWKLAPAHLRGLHDGDQAGGADAAHAPRVRAASSRSAACPRASSTSSPASARRRGAASSPTRTWTRSRSPAAWRSAR